MSVTVVGGLRDKLDRIIREFRSIGTFYHGDLKVNEMEYSGEEYIVRGDYAYRTLFGETVERGSFEIILDSRMNPKKVKISAHR